MVSYYCFDVPGLAVSCGITYCRKHKLQVYTRAIFADCFRPRKANKTFVLKALLKLQQPNRTRLCVSSGLLRHMIYTQIGGGVNPFNASCSELLLFKEFAAILV